MLTLPTPRPAQSARWRVRRRRGRTDASLRLRQLRADRLAADPRTAGSRPGPRPALAPCCRGRRAQAIVQRTSGLHHQRPPALVRTTQAARPSRPTRCAGPSASSTGKPRRWWRRLARGSARRGFRPQETLDQRETGGLYAARRLAGAIAQLGERLNGIQEVRGSTPLGSTNEINELDRQPVQSPRKCPRYVRAGWEPASLWPTGLLRLKNATDSAILLVR